VISSLSINYSQSFLLPLIVAPLLILSGCSRLTTESNSSPRNPEVLVSSRPPFNTKEPERYRAMRVTTSEEANSGSSPAITQTSVTVIVRSGPNRREEYKSNQTELVYLENQNGRFLLVPALKSFGELNTQNAITSALPLDDANGANVTQGLLADASASAVYQPLGAEEFNGRRTIKYLVRQNLNAADTASRDTFIWVDDELGIPIRSESTHNAAGKTFRYLTELREISTQVDEKAFVIPTGYQQVEFSHLSQRIAKLQR
jgi:outer membrane lipoprotein-sorting protein